MKHNQILFGAYLHHGLILTVSTRIGTETTKPYSSDANTITHCISEITDGLTNRTHALCPQRAHATQTYKQEQDAKKQTETQDKATFFITDHIKKYSAKETIELTCKGMIELTMAAICPLYFRRQHRNRRLKRGGTQRSTQKQDRTKPRSSSRTVGNDRLFHKPSS